MEIDFKNQVFVHSPDMYERLFIEEEKVDDSMIEEFVPESEDDMKAMLRQLKSQGVIS